MPVPLRRLIMKKTMEWDMRMFKRLINTVISGGIGLFFGFVLFRLLVAVFGSVWSVAEGGPWLVVYSPFIILTLVGLTVGFFKKAVRALVACLITLAAFLFGGLLLMLVAGMFVGGGAIIVVAVVGVIAGGIVVLNTVVR